MASEHITLPNKTNILVAVVVVVDVVVDGSIPDRYLR